MAVWELTGGPVGRWGFRSVVGGRIWSREALDLSRELGARMSPLVVDGFKPPARRRSLEATGRTPTARGAVGRAETRGSGSREVGRGLPDGLVLTTVEFEVLGSILPTK